VVEWPTNNVLKIERFYLVICPTHDVHIPHKVSYVLTGSATKQN